MTKIFFVFLLILPFSVIFSNAYADISIIVSTQTFVHSLTAEEVKAIYLGRARSFPNGDSAIPSLNGNKDLTEKFLLKITDKSSAQFDSFWNVKQFTAQGSSPRVLSNDNEVKNWITNHSNGIGYIDSSSLDRDDKKIRSVLIISGN